MTFNTELAADGPGLLLRDIITDRSPRVASTIAVITHLRPDILALQSFDYDANGAALAALQGRLKNAGHPMVHAFALRPNTGEASQADLDVDGRLGGPRDAQGYGNFAGEGGMALLSTLPILADDAVDLSSMLWVDLPDHTLPAPLGEGWPSADVHALQKLSTTGHWLVPVDTSFGPLMVGMWHASPPVFDGVEDRNGLRNHDETLLWLRLLDGRLDSPAPLGPLVLMGDGNLDPMDGDGRTEAIRALLSHPRLQDVEPRRSGPVPEAAGINRRHIGDPALDTADWRDGPGDPGNLRVDYVLPSSDLQVVDSGVFWPAPDDPLAALLGAPGEGSRHRAVWVDVTMDP